MASLSTSRNEYHVATARLESDDERNLLDLALLVQLRDELERLHDDQDCRCVVLTGGGTFSEGWAPEVEAEPGLLAQAAGSLEWMAELRLPVIAAIGGACRGGGLELALACDLRIAAPQADFQLGESYPLAGGVQRIARLAGRGQALAMLLLAQPVTAAEAARSGLVNEVADDPLARAQEIAQLIAQRGPIGVHYAKEAIHRGVDLPLEQALRYETDLTIILQATADRAEGVQAFLEKRTPQFRGQ